MLYHHITPPTLAALTLCALPAFANDGLTIVTDIAPVHSLTAQVMGDLGEPILLVGPSDSPHNFALRPSQAAALQKADATFWIGPDLTPWLEDSLATLIQSGTAVALLEADGALELPFREGPIFASAEGDDHEGHDNDDHAKEEGHDEHGHDDHAKEEGHDDHGHDDHAEKAGHEGHNHAHDGADPHGWLSPDNASLWLTVIADTLSEIAPEHADTFQANATAAQDALAQTVSEVSATLAPVKGQGFIVYHDAYQYFETHFGLTSLGSVAIGDAAAPSPKRIAELRAHIQEDNLACAFAEPQLNARLLDTVLEGEGVKVLEIDPLGSALPQGPGLYNALLTDMANSFATCAD